MIHGEGKQKDESCRVSAAAGLPNFQKIDYQLLVMQCHACRCMAMIGMCALARFLSGSLSFRCPDAVRRQVHAFSDGSVHLGQMAFKHIQVILERK